MKNRIVAAALVLCLLLTLCACGKKGRSETENTTQEPTTIPSPVLPESARVAPGYFDDVLFIGDSISEGLATFASSGQVLGAAQFLTSVSLSATNALWEVSSRSVHPREQRQKMKVEDAVPKTGKTKVYLMLGMNDIISVGVERSVENFETLCTRIQENAPQTQIFVQSVTPIVGEGRTSGEHTLNNTTITRYNDLLQELCLQNGWHYLDIASVLRDGTGHLNASFCSDPSGMGMHLNRSGWEAWIEYLYTHTA